MPNRIAFRDYARQGGGNAIAEWQADLPAGARARLTTILQHLANDVNWRGSPYVSPLKGDGKGLLEVKFIHQNTQYRPLLMKGPGNGEFTLLMGAIERGDDFEPREAVRTAQDRKREVEADPRRAVPHVWK